MGWSRKKDEEKAREIRKRNALEGYRAFGRLAEHGKDFDQALREYGRAASEFPDQAGPSYWIGALHARNNEYARAFEVYEKLLEKEPRPMAACYEIGRVAVLSGQRLERWDE